MAFSYLQIVFSWQTSSVSGKRVFSFHHSCAQHGKDFLSWKNEDNCSSGWADFKTWTLCSRRQQARPSKREENVTNQDIALYLSVFSLTQQCGAMSFHQPPVQKSRRLQNSEQLSVSAWPGRSRLLFCLCPGYGEIFSFFLFYKMKTNSYSLHWDWNTNYSGPNIHKYWTFMLQHFLTFWQTDDPCRQLQLFSDGDFGRRGFPGGVPKFIPLHKANLYNGQHRKALLPFWAPG